MLKQRHQLFVALFALMDGLVTAGACWLAWAMRRIFVDQSWPAMSEASLSAEWFREPLALLVVPITLGVFLVGGMYRPRRDRSMVVEAIAVFRNALLALAMIVVVLWAAGGQVGAGASEPIGGGLLIGQVTLDGERAQLAALAVLLPIMLIGFRVTLRLVLRGVRQRGRNLRHVAVIGVGRLGQICSRTLSRNGWTGLHVAYHIAHTPTTTRTACLGRPVMGGLDDLEAVLAEHRVDAVYLALPASAAAKVPQLLRRLERFAVDVRIVPDVPLRYMPQHMVVSELEGMPILSCRESPLHGVGGASKRVLDVLGAAAALLLFSPVMLAAAAAVRLSGPGPVIFRQRRVGLGGEEFTILKFRTMRHASEEANPEQLDPARLDDPREAWTQRNDPRVTRIGRILRSTSLDELPQLFNVLRGEMSLVGPRPERPELIERFKEDWRGYMLRQHVKAGMTGWAQVKGHRGHSDLRKRLQLDLFYVRHWSLRLDLWILWLTVFRGFIHRNAH